MPIESLGALIEGVAQALSLGLNLTSLAQKPQVERLVDELKNLQQCCADLSAREPFEPSLLEVAELSKLVSRVSAASRELGPRSTPCLRALPVLVKAAESTADLALSSRLERHHTQQVVNAVEKLVRQLALEFSIKQPTSY